MLVTRVKICGITNYQDALAAIECGADIIGFNFFAGSPRFIRMEEASKMARDLPAFVELAGVFVNAPVQQVRDVAGECYLDWVQLHGDEGPEICTALATDTVKTIKAIRVKGRADLDLIGQCRVDAVLLDTFCPDRYGGTGTSFDWGLLNCGMERRIFLAGGINPQNVGAAIALGVYGIDICSGVEAYPGKKDHDKLKQLFDAILHTRG